MKTIYTIIKHDLRLSVRQRVGNAMVVTFFVLAVALFPFGVGPEPSELAKIAPGVIWVSALLAAMLSLERLFQSDFEDGSLELIALQPTELEFIVLAKVIVHWITTGIPLIIVTPFLSVLMNVPENGFWVLAISLAIGTPSLSLIGGIGAALIIGSKRGGVLLSLIILPLYVPVLIFGVNSVNAVINSFSVQSHFLILTAIFLAALSLCPWIGASAIRQALAT